MSKIVNETHQQIRQAILDAMGKAVSAGTLPAEPVCDFKIEVPADNKNGDFSSNVAMMSTKALRMNPRKIGETILENIDLKGTYLERCEIAGPGFLNFYLSPSYYSAILKDVRECGKDYGRSD